MGVAKAQVRTMICDNGQLPPWAGAGNEVIDAESDLKCSQEIKDATQAWCYRGVLSPRPLGTDSRQSFNFQNLTVGFLWGFFSGGWVQNSFSLPILKIHIFQLSYFWITNCLSLSPLCNDVNKWPWLV